MCHIWSFFKYLVSEYKHFIFCSVELLVGAPQDLKGYLWSRFVVELHP